jgi:hypothetical protein
MPGPKQEEEKETGTSHIAVLKALVDHALGGDVHPDQRATLEAWRDQHTTAQERDDRLTDDERAEREAAKAAKASEGADKP